MLVTAASDIGMKLQRSSLCEKTKSWTQVFLQVNRSVVLRESKELQKRYDEHEGHHEDMQGSEEGCDETLLPKGA